MVSKNDMPELFQMFQDYWLLIRQIWRIDDTDEYFEDMVKKCSDFAGKYKNIKDCDGYYLKAYAKGLTNALLDEIDRRYKLGVESIKAK